MIEVGHDVVCIQDDWSKNILQDAPPTPGPWPIKGQIYKVTGIRPLSSILPQALEFDPILLQLQECHPGVWYVQDNFRPVKKTDISDLLKLQTPTPNKRVPLTEVAMKPSVRAAFLRGMRIRT